MKRILLCKRLLSFLMVYIVSVSIFAQDVIVKKDGSTIMGKVIEIGTSEIKYKKWTNQSGPTYAIAVSDLFAINYENGDKDTFDAVENTPVTGKARLLPVLADHRNNDLIALYNRTYEPGPKIKGKGKEAGQVLVIFGVTKSSKMSNKDIEMTFESKIIPAPSMKECSQAVFYVTLKNKSSRTLYVDRGNSFRVNPGGDYLCYYSPTEQTTVTSGGTNGMGLSLGSVAGILNIGGTVGTLAYGTSVFGAKQHSVSTTYIEQRFLAIPPGGQRYLTERKWIKLKPGNILVDAVWELDGVSEEPKYVREDIEKIIIGKPKIYEEAEAPTATKYIITYSNTEDFSTYSTLDVQLFVKEVIGVKNWFLADEETIIEKPEKYLLGSDKNTLFGLYYYDKEGTEAASEAEADFFNP
ncbi:MAG: hypothetical protein Q4F22_06385 [Phascolarctobacterium sp.]|nr:hypothetical protein [Phascolarctobacterium sp.]